MSKRRIQRRTWKRWSWERRNPFRNVRSGPSDFEYWLENPAAYFGSRSAGDDCPGGLAVQKCGHNGFELGGGVHRRSAGSETDLRPRAQFQLKRKPQDQVCGLPLHGTNFGWHAAQVIKLLFLTIRRIQEIYYEKVFD